MRRVSIIAVLALLPAPGAFASYSAPLTRVRIDRDRVTHTPSIFFARDKRVGATFATDLSSYGAQYVGQWEWASGFGVQAAAAAAYADLQLGLGLDANTTDPRATINAKGYLAGAQLRAYHLIWSGGGGERPHALTAFANLRVVFYRATGNLATDAIQTRDVQARLLTLSGGAGLMAEFALGSYVSICPYAWFSPGLYQDSRYKVGLDGEIVEKGELSLRQPLRAGVDAWIYPFGARDEAHFSLSAIASLIDTNDRGSNEFSIILGWTF